MSLAGLRNKKKVIVKQEFYHDALDDNSTFMRITSDISSEITRFSSQYESPVIWTSAIVLQDDEVTGGETYVLDFYKNDVLQQTLTFLSPAADVIKKVSWSPVIKTKQNDEIQLKLKSSVALADDEVLVTIWGSYYS
jgi:hypothetical protein